MPTVCSYLPLFPQAYFLLLLLLLLLCGVLAKPDWTETRAPREAEPTPRCAAELKMLVSVYLILLLLCVFAYLTAELPLTVLYLSLPLRKLLQYLWLLCNSECGYVCECLYVCLWMRGSGKSSAHLTELFSVLLKFILFFSFFFSCSLRPKPGFYHKAGQPNLHR